MGARLLFLVLTVRNKKVFISIIVELFYDRRGKDLGVQRATSLGKSGIPIRPSPRSQVHINTFN